jgi:hypothetical protein
MATAMRPPVRRVRLTSIRPPTGSGHRWREFIKSDRRCGRGHEENDKRHGRAGDAQPRQRQ